MSRMFFRAIGALLLLLLIAAPFVVLAHEEITAGNYVIEYGWQEEPPLAGQPNAIVLNFSAAEAHGEVEAGRIRIVAPADDSTVNGDALDITIRVEEVDEHAMESGHWHLYVDERVVAMAPLSQDTVTVTGLSNGSHTVEAVLAASDHGEFGDPAHAGITVEGSSATGDPSAGGVETLEAEHAQGVEVDVSGLSAEMVYGGETTPLKVEPLPDGETGQFKADFTPERPGKYTLKLGGRLTGGPGETEVNVEVEPEEVMPGPTPAATPLPQTGAMPLILIGAIVAAVSAFAVWFFVARNKK